MFINYMPDAASSMCQLFADDAKIFRGIQSKDDISALQEDFDRLVAWSVNLHLTWITSNYNISEEEMLTQIPNEWTRSGA